MKNTKIEEFREIENYPNYLISNFGRVKSIKNSKSKILHHFDNGYGYRFVTLCNRNQKKFFKIHRLVAKAFPEICGEWWEGCDIDHINGNRNDNRAENLRTCTRRENCCNPLSLLKYKFANKVRIPILQISLDGEILNRFDSVLNAARILNINKQSIYNVLHGRFKTTHGCYFQYDF